MSSYSSLRSAQRIRYYSDPTKPSKVTSSLRVRKVDPEVAARMIATSALARLDRVSYDPNSSVMERSENDLIHLYY